MENNSPVKYRQSCYAYLFMSMLRQYEERQHVPLYMHEGKTTNSNPFTLMVRPTSCLHGPNLSLTLYRYSVTRAPEQQAAAGHGHAMVASSRQVLIPEIPLPVPPGEVSTGAAP